jgi:hypothetical protein
VSVFCPLHGIEAAIELANAAAGDEDVGVWAGANI